MGLQSRRFLNLIVDHGQSIKSLRRIDLKRLQLFYPTTMSPPTPTRRPGTATTMETFGLPSPTINFQACSTGAVRHQWRVACYPLTQRKVLCTDQCGRNFLYDAGTHQVATMPEFHMPRLHSLSLFIPSGQGEDDDGEEGSKEEDEDGCGDEGSLFLMEKFVGSVTGGCIGHQTDDIEVLFYGSNGSRVSHCKLLPPPPSYCNANYKIDSYAVVGNGSHVCISVDGRGTYFLDTATHTWDKVGDWTLPFLGKVEYVPELKLWFGLSADGQHLAAADLSNTDYYQQPEQLVDGWKEFQAPKDWHEFKDAQLVNLGSGRFCIARFFSYYDLEDDTSLDFAVLTGVVLPRPRVLANGEVKLEMIPHKSMCQTSHNARDLIGLVF